MKKIEIKNEVPEFEIKMKLKLKKILAWVLTLQLSTQHKNEIEKSYWIEKKNIEWSSGKWN